MTQTRDKVEPNELTHAVWLGNGAEVLGLSGEVRKKDFEAVFNARRLKG
jgi:hypothetical protein